MSSGPHGLRRPLASSLSCNEPRLTKKCRKTHSESFNTGLTSRSTSALLQALPISTYTERCRYALEQAVQVVTLLCHATQDIDLRQDVPANGILWHLQSTHWNKSERNCVCLSSMQPGNLQKRMLIFVSLSSSAACHARGVNVCIYFIC